VALCSRAISSEGDNADHSLFTSQYGQLAEISFAHQLFSFSDGLVFKAIDGFLIQFRLGELYLRIVAETPDFAVKLALRHRTSNNIRSRREPLFQSLRAFFSPPVVISKGDSNASIRVWEKLMKRGELHDVS
jgi:hypothetical protein